MPCVTGGGRGIGASIVRALSAEGAKVSMLGRTAATLEGLAAELKSAGAETFCATADVAKRESLDAAFAAARTMFGPIEISDQQCRPGNQRPDHQAR